MTAGCVHVIDRIETAVLRGNAARNERSENPMTRHVRVVLLSRVDPCRQSAHGSGFEIRSCKDRRPWRSPTVDSSRPAESARLGESSCPTLPAPLFFTFCATGGFDPSRGHAPVVPTADAVIGRQTRAKPPGEFGPGNTAVNSIGLHLSPPGPAETPCDRSRDARCPPAGWFPLFGDTSGLVAPPRAIAQDELVHLVGRGPSGTATLGANHLIQSPL